ncbi:MAG TPA: hypothetical protein DEF48_26185 [Nostoc sp. UBA8866]|nr:hypothetical protein DSM107007_43040 [Nostoc sp. PCC 7120 = FACHB-418]HBW33501.1 hypothetical protein [Nostoc sp. UBA8866]
MTKLLVFQSVENLAESEYCLPKDYDSLPTGLEQNHYLYRCIAMEENNVNFYEASFQNLALSWGKI